MSVAIWGAASVLALLALAVLAVLASPVVFRFLWVSTPTSRMTIGVRLLGGFTPIITVHDSARQKLKRSKPGKKRRKKTSSDNRRRSSGKFARDVAAEPRLVTDLLAPIHVERLAIDADIGLADPAETGHLFGLLAALQYSHPPSETLFIAIRPNFSGPTAAGRIDARLRFVPLAFLPPGIRFARQVFGGSRAG